MDKNQTPQQQPATTQEQPSFEDFFTIYIDKKKRNFTKKLNKVSLLQEKDFNSLTKEQQAMITNRQKLVDEVNYYESIKDHYKKAISKKKPELLKKQVEPKPEKKDGCDYADCCNKTVGLFYLGNFVRNSGEAAMRIFAKEDMGIEFQERLLSYHKQVFQAESYRFDDLTKAEGSLLNYLKDGSVVDGVKGILERKLMEEKEEENQPEEVQKEESVEEVVEVVKEDPVVEEPEEEVVEKKQTQGQNIGKPNLFVMTSEEEDNAEEEAPEEEKSKEEEVKEVKEFEEDKKEETVKEVKEGDSEEEYVIPKIVPLPEESDDDMTFSKPKKQRKPRKKRKQDRGDYYKGRHDEQDEYQEKRGGRRDNRGRNNRNRRNKSREGDYYRQQNEYQKKE